MRLQWDLFCRVIDNFGDVGVAWRLAADLAGRGQRVRLWIDDASALAWMAPGGAPDGVEVLRWEAASEPGVQVGDIVIETFGCELPAAFVARMAERGSQGLPAPHWLNLEYLSAEPYVERSHGLASPQYSGPGRGLDKHFFYPGFSARTGGLLREPGLLAERERFDGAAWLAARGLARQRGERVVSLFAYANPQLPALLDLLAADPAQPTLLLVCPGSAQQQLALQAPRPHLRWQALPYLSQPDYDRLLWASDLNFVRGEDSFVRAQWAGQPFVWQIYPQEDGAHAPKLGAFLDLFLAAAGPALAAATRALWRGWNGLADWPAALPEMAESRAQALLWRAHLAAQPDLASQLLSRFGVSG
ncbi:elongation factor P maturation arginine rhamnosyltransferase EarP [Roseateles violae]|uniref:Protein-arginine rhamnosyltransferase n=1 Tax=Roseateles violae TaxID=3058042 RepID=A0ABT8DQP5_9BURK|nr:elongation factor P maturation arginine rhamnosyltransferase EarP [Pelomonas sp. PFR6]MDN3920283.1 elongation factor P maturation arginine rhamnosyltransferase EarP [Pelomonas sp. PFR6]